MTEMRDIERRRACPNSNNDKYYIIVPIMLYVLP